MGVDAGDYDGDLEIDFVVPCVWQQVFTLYRNEGTHFTDVSWRAGLVGPTSPMTGFSPSFLDYDNDGDLDLLFTTGGVRMNETCPADGTYEERYGMPDLLLASDGKGHYVDVSRQAGPHFSRKTIGRGSVVGDLDNDGDLDIVIANLAARPAVLRNDTQPRGRWIQVKLVPKRGNKDALGSSVWVEAGGRKQRSVVRGCGTYLSQNDRRIHFGLGNAEKVDRLEVLWPDRSRQVLQDLAVDRLLTIVQGEEGAK